MSLTWRGGPRGLLATVLLVFVIVCPYEAMGQCSGQWPAVCDSSNNNCRDYLARWDYVAGLVQFTVTATQSRNKWVAIAFSRDRTMGQTDVVMGFVSYSGGTVFDGWITERIATPTRDSDSQLIQPFINYADGTYTLSFLRTIPSSDPQDLALDQDLYFIFPVGGGTYSPSTGIIRQHSRTPSISSGTYNLAGCGSSGGNPTTAGTTAPPPTTTTPPPTTTTRTTTTSTTTTPPPTTTTRTTTTSTTTTQAPITTTTGSTTSTTTTASRDCRNMFSPEVYCYQWAATGECFTGVNQQWMQDNCALACNCGAESTATTTPELRTTTTEMPTTTTTMPATETGTTTVPTTTTTVPTTTTTTLMMDTTTMSGESVCENAWAREATGSDGECTSWAATGECLGNNQDWMLTNCWAACSYCAAGQTECHMMYSDAAQCLAWARNGDCGSVWMTNNCYGACATGCANSADSETTTTSTITTTTATTSATTTTVATVTSDPSMSGCMNIHDDDAECAQWASSGQCDSSQWMMVNCRMACTDCSSQGTTPRTTEDCVNIHDDDAECAQWASSGQCDSSAVWMMVNCRMACTDCTPEGTTPRTTEGCMNIHDDDGECALWASSGQCDSSQWMMVNCRMACTDCTPEGTTPRTTEDCVNIHDDDAECAQWASSGQCDSSAVWMMVNCRMACTDCSPEGTTPRTTEGCMNIHDDDGECAQWASSGQCDNSEWMMVNCRMACTDCTPEGTTPRTTEGCEDLHQPASECRDWAAIGQCRDNPDWMLENCQLSCTNCHITESCVNANGDDDQCVFWAFDGQCSSNPEFMLESCARACSACPATVITPNFYYGGSVSSELGPWTEIVCQGTRLDVTCPAGYVLHVNGGFFGRMDGLDLCVAQGQYVNMGQDCTDTQALQQLIRLCDYSPECSLYVDPTVFIDPCPNQQSYLNVSLSCQLAVFQQWSCEDTDMTLFCEEPNQAIHIEFANFGRTEGLLCPDPNADMSVRCESDAAWNVTTSMCNGRNSCHLFPSTDLFGDTCTGTRRYAHVAYTCGECVNEHEDEDECEGWADDGQCELNQEWMMARCRKSCTRCHLTDTCLDLDVSGSCAYWAYRGGCITNADYMLNNCAQTCNYCDDIYWPPPPTAAPTTWAPLVLPDNVRYEIACNYTNAILNCPEGTYVRVLDAFFGRRDPLKCTGGIPETTCDNYVADTFHIVRDLCNGRTNCTLWAGGEPPFTEPCHYTSKYLEVNFTCDACVNRHGDDAECQNWADFYNCDSNQYWMHSNCYKACSGCDTANTCENYLEDRLCDYYASWNQCTDNAAYMLYTCPKSCRSCWIYN